VTPQVRAALVFAKRLRMSGQQSTEARAIIVLADAVLKLLVTVARVRRDRTAWRQVAAIAMSKPGEK